MLRVAATSQDRSSTRRALLLFSILLCMFVAYYLNFSSDIHVDYSELLSEQGIENLINFLSLKVIYSDLFYIPIVLTSLWYRKKVIWVAASLSLFHMFISYSSVGFLMIGFVERSIILIFIAYIIALICEQREKRTLELKRSEEKYGSLVESSDDFIYMLDVDGRYLSANNKLLSFLDLPLREVLGKSVRELFIHDDIEQFLSNISKVITHATFVTFEHHDRQLKQWFLVTLSPVKDPSSGSVTAVSVVAKDITERKEAEESLRAAYSQLKETQNQLIQSEKMTALGKLASGMAHEIRNPLGIIVMGIDFLTGSLNHKDAETKAIIRSINDAVNRANAVIGATMEFSRTSMVAFENVSVHDVLDDAVSFLQQGSKKKKLTILKNYTDEDIKVRSDKQMLEQAFFNIMLNSVDAMPNGGQITLRTCVKRVEHAAFLTGHRESDYFKIGDPICVIEIEDTGTGIPPEIMPKIFDPFFTTKEVGSGTGLGLSVVHLIIDRHTGIVDVRSELNKGTIFTVYLPTGYQTAGSEVAR